MALDRLSWFYYIGSAIGFTIALIGLIGELRGWWNDVGEWMIGLGTGVGVVLGAVGTMWGASRGQADRIGHAVERNGDQLGAANVKLDRANGKLDLANGKLDLANGKLDLVVLQLDKLDALEPIQLELDRQTGVLDRQLGVLAAIRDRI